MASLPSLGSTGHLFPPLGLCSGRGLRGISGGGWEGREVEPQALSFLPWEHGPVLAIFVTSRLFPGGEKPALALLAKVY